MRHRKHENKLSVPYFYAKIKPTPFSICSICPASLKTFCKDILVIAPSVAFVNLSLCFFHVFYIFLCSFNKKYAKTRIFHLGLGVKIREFSSSLLYPAMCFRQHLAASAVPIAVPYSPSFGT